MPQREIVDITANSEAAVTPDMLQTKPLGRGRLAPASGAAQAPPVAPTPAVPAAEKPQPELTAAQRMLRNLETTIAAWKAILDNEKTPEHARKRYEEKVLYLFAAKQELDPPPATPQQPTAEPNGGA